VDKGKNQEVAPEAIKTQWQEARANRRMQFKVDDCKDSNIRMLTGAIKADWTLPVETHLAALPTLKQGVIITHTKPTKQKYWLVVLQCETVKQIAFSDKSDSQYFSSSM